MALTSDDIDRMSAMIQTGQSQTLDRGDNGAAADDQNQNNTAATDGTASTQGGDNNTATTQNAAASGEDEHEIIGIEEFGVQSVVELRNFLSERQQLLQQVQELSEYKAGPKFKNDRQKFLYDFATREDGMELDSARQLLEIVSLGDLKSVPDQQTRFMAFRLNPENKGLSQEEIQALFLEKEAEYGDPTDQVNPPTAAQKARANRDTQKARETLQKIVTDWEGARPAQVSPEQTAREEAAYRQQMNQQLTSFDGINLTLMAQGDKGEKLEGALNFKLDPNQKASLMQAMTDPQGWWEGKLNSIGAFTDSGIDFTKFANLVAQFEFAEQMRNAAYQQGRADHLADQLKTRRNVSDPSTPGAAATPPPSPVDKKAAATKAFLKVVGG